MADTISKYKSSHYNGPAEDITDAAGEAGSLEVLHGLTRTAEITNLIGHSTMEKIMADGLRLAFYVHAMTYGGYTPEDIVKDMKREDLYDKGDKEMGDLSVISADLNKTDYYKSEEGMAARSLATTKIPDVNVGIWGNNSALKYMVRDMPDALFKTIVPMSDTKSQAYKDAVEGVKSMYADYSDALLAAAPGQAAAIAKANWDEFTRQVNEKYGVQLQNNATKDWNALEALATGMAGRNLSGSGLEAEAIDDTLAQTRKTNQRERVAKLSEVDQKRAAAILSTWSDKEIGALSAEEREKYGLNVPTEIAATMNFDALKKKYPDASDEEIQSMVDQFMSKNPDGTYSYHSTLYKNYHDQRVANAASRKTYAMGEVDTERARKSAEEMANLESGMPFSDATNTGMSQTETEAYWKDKSQSDPKNPLTHDLRNVAPATPAPVYGQSGQQSWTAENQRSSGVQLPPDYKNPMIKAITPTPAAPVSTTNTNTGGLSAEDLANINKAAKAGGLTGTYDPITGKFK
jgi:hypothetical protein